MPGAEQQAPPPLVQPFARSCRSAQCRLQTPKARTGPGAGYIERSAAPLSAPLFTAPHCVGRTAQASIAACGPICSIRCSPRSPACPASGRSWRSSMRRLLGRESAARRRSAVPSAVRRDRPPRAAQAQRGAGRPGRHRRGDGRRAPARAAAPAARALPHRSPATTPAHADADLFQRAPRLSGEAAAGRRDALRLRHRRSSTTACCRWCIPTAWSTRRALPICRWSSRSIRSPKGSRSAMCGAPMDGALARLPALPEWQDEAWVARERLPDFRAGAAAAAPAGASRTTLLPESPAWTRLAYDELLAGQLALALVRAHMRRQAGRGSAERRPVARAASSKALPYSLTHSQQQAVDDIVTDLAQPAAHVAPAARRRRLRQDRGGAARGRDRDRGRTAGRA